MDSEIKEVVYLAVAAMILSIVLGLANVVAYTSREMTDSRNDEVRGKESVQEYRKFNKYNRNTVNGDEVVECVTSYYDSGIEILVLNENYALANKVYIADSDGNEYSENYRVTDKFLRYRKNDTIMGKTNKYKSGNLKDVYRTESLYRAYLVYDSEPIGEKFNDMFKKPVYNEQDMDLAYGNQSIGTSNVTGIIFIRTK